MKARRALRAWAAQQDRKEKEELQQSLVTDSGKVRNVMPNVDRTQPGLSSILSLMKKQCNPSLITYGTAQCIQCKMLADDHEEVCGICQGDLRGPQWPAPGQESSSSSTSEAVVGRANEAASQDSFLKAETSEAAATMKVSL